MQEFPKWKYHRSNPACVVDDRKHEISLGDEWEDTPAAFENDPANADSSLKHEEPPVANTEEPAPIVETEIKIEVPAPKKTSRKKKTGV